MSEIREQDARTVLLLGEDGFNKLTKAHVLIVGIGGVGGYAAEQVVRAGIGEITIIDADVINESNINRQILALNSNINTPKTEVAKARMLDINPKLKIHLKKYFLSEGEIEQFLQQNKYDYIVDAIDTLRPKVDLLASCIDLKIPVVSSMGAGGKTDPGKVQIAEIENTFNCKLARMVRKRLHKKGYNKGFKAVFSTEFADKNAMIYEKSQNKLTNTGTISYMPAIFGIYCSSVVIRDLIQKT